MNTLLGRCSLPMYWDLAFRMLYRHGLTNVNNLIYSTLQIAEIICAVARGGAQAMIPWA